MSCVAVVASDTLNEEKGVADPSCHARAINYALYENENAICIAKYRI